MLRYREDSEDLKVGVTELKEQLEISEEAGVSIRRIAQQAMNENGQKICNLQAGRRRGMYCQSGQLECAVERSGGFGKKCQNMMQEVKLFSERQEVLKGMVEDKIRLQSRATEKYYEQIF